LIQALRVSGEVIYDPFLKTEPLDVGASYISDETVVFQNLKFSGQVFVYVQVVG
jgi:hypothetical protein